MSFCLEKCALLGTASQLGHNPGLWPPTLAKLSGQSPGL